MKKFALNQLKCRIKCLVFGLAMTLSSGVIGMEAKSDFPIVQSSFPASKYERVLMTQLRDLNTTMDKFRESSNKLAELLVHRVVECLPSASVSIQTPLAGFQGESLEGSVEFVSVMRSGDALLGVFEKHFPHAAISKILIQRNEETAKPEFKYMKLSPTISKGVVVISEPMIATGGTLEMVINLLKERGVAEENIIIASVLAAPEGLAILNQQFPKIKIVVISIDEQLNGNKFIVPGLGDFGNRYFGV